MNKYAKDDEKCEPADCISDVHVILIFNIEELHRHPIKWMDADILTEWFEEIVSKSPGLNLY